MSLKRSGCTIGAIVLLIAIWAAVNWPLSHEQLFLLYGAFLLIILAVAVVLHRYDMQQYKAKEHNDQISLQEHLLAQSNILKELRGANTILWSIVQLVGGDHQDVLDELPPFDDHPSNVGTLAEKQAAMVWELQLTFRMKKTLLIVLTEPDKRIPDLPRFYDDHTLDARSRERNAQIAIAEVLGRINAVDAKLMMIPGVQQLLKLGDEP